MEQRLIRTACIVVAGMAALSGADWLTFSGDPERTGWAKNEEKISKENVGKLKLEWKLKLDNAPKELNSLTVPVIAGGVITPRGFMEVAVVAGASDTVFAIDTDSGNLLWHKKLSTEGNPRNPPHWLCPNALNATPLIEKRSRTVHVIASDGKLHSLSLVNGEDRMPPVEFVPPFSKNWSLNLVDGVLYTTTSQGCNGAKSAVYAMDLNDPKRPVAHFLATTTGGAGIWGRAGAAISTKNNLVVAETGDGPYDPAAGKYADTFLGLATKSLKLADYYTPSNREWITRKDLDMGNISAIIFPFKQWELIAGSGKEGIIFLLDAKSMGGADHRTPLFRSPLFTNDEANFWGKGFWGAFATWEDAKGTRWLLAPAFGPQGAKSPEFPVTYGPAPNGSIMAFKLDVKDNKPVLAPGWRSRDMQYPEPPIVANGIVFAISNGENVQQVDSDGKILPSSFRASNPTGNAVLYAFDGETGKELYSSGKTIPGFTHFSGLAMASGRLFVVTHDSTVYALGLGTQY